MSAQAASGDVFSSLYYKYGDIRTYDWPTFAFTAKGGCCPLHGFI